jgi:chromosome segregation ATPase
MSTEEFTPGFSVLLDRIKAIEDSNCSNRLAYLQTQFDDATKSITNARLIKGEIQNKLDDFNSRLRKIESFTEYLLAYFNPDNKLKKEIDKLSDELKQKDLELKKLRGKLKELVS